MRADEFQERRLVLAGWPVSLSSYRLGEVWYSKADNVSAGAGLCRARGATREEAEQKAIQRAEELLSRTKLHQV